MIDKDKVMKSIECCLRPDNTNLCGECSYKNVPYDCKHALIKDVHELLIEQEPVSEERNMNENTKNPVMETAIELLKSVRENIEFAGNNSVKRQRIGSEWAGYCKGIRDACWVIDDFIKSIEKKMS